MGVDDLAEAMMHLDVEQVKINRSLQRRLEALENTGKPWKEASSDADPDDMGNRMAEVGVA